MERTAIAGNTKWILDPIHSEVFFKVKHLMISTITGQFKKFTGIVETNDDDFTTAKVYFIAEIDSISTGNDQRDAHLKNGDFFDADNYPQLIFEGEKLEKTDEDEYKLHGVLTIRGSSKRVTLDVQFGGLTNDPWGNTRVGFSVSGKLDRQDYGVSFGAVTETGGLLLGNEIKIYAEVQFVKQQVPEVVS